jgi:DinB superfamily
VKTPPDPTAVAVSLEIGSKRTFARAIDWPGWCRAGRSEEDALEALLAYAPRYRAVVGALSIGFSPPAGLGDLRVMERVEGGPTTDFGAPGSPAPSDERPWRPPELAREVAILQAAWTAFDAAAAGASGVALRTGPRGGGRDVAKMVAHVREAEEGYLVKLGSRRPREKDPAQQMTRIRSTALDALADLAQGRPIAEPSQVQSRWSPRFFVRRSAWHALDHAWEIQDRS